MSKVVVSGYYGSKNAGDEAMLAAMLEVVTDLDPEIDITVISANPEDTRQRHGVKAVSWLSVPAVLSALSGADLLISGGGSLLQNVTSGRSLYYYLGVIFLARLVGTPVMLYAQGIGPVYGGFARWLMRKIVGGVDLITVRDNGSMQELDSLGITAPRREVTADPVLAIHPVDLNIGRGILKKFKVSGARPVIGISVRDWQGWTQYKKVLAEAAQRIEDELNARVVFLPMQYPEDVQSSQSVLELSKSQAIVLNDEYTTGELLSIVGNLDLLISVRLHALIFAGVMGVPMIGVSYDPKIERFQDSIGDKPVADLQSVTVEKIMAEVQSKWANRKELRVKNSALLSELRRLAARNAELALELCQRKKH